MAGQDTDEIRVFANGTISVAPVGTPLPAGPHSALDSDFVDLGLTSEDGVTARDAKSMFEVPVWQLMYPGRRGVEGRDFTVQFVLRQWNGDTFLFAFGGGDITSVTGGHRFDPPDPEHVDERSMVITALDGTITDRLVIPRGTITDDVETQLVRNAAADLPITFGVIGQDGVEPWYFLSDDPAMVAS